MARQYHTVVTALLLNGGTMTQEELAAELPPSATHQAFKRLDGKIVPYRLSTYIWNARKQGVNIKVTRAGKITSYTLEAPTETAVLMLTDRRPKMMQIDPVTGFQIAA